MVKSIRVSHLLFLIPVIILGFLIFISRSSVLHLHQGSVSLHIILDLLITIPIVCFFIIRRFKLPLFTTLYPFAIGLFIAPFLIEPEHHVLISTIKLVAIPLIEITIVGVIIRKFLTLVKTFKAKKRNTFDFYDNLLHACAEIFPGRVGKLLATEISVFYYLLPFAKKRKADKNNFSYFIKSNIKSTVGAFLFILAIETIVVHLLVDSWSPTTAWVLSILGIYTGLQIVSILRSLDKRLITIDEVSKVLHLRYGFACYTEIPFASIDNIVTTQKDPIDNKGNVKLSLFDLLDPHNTVLYLNEELTLHKLYGMSKKYRSISLSVDEKEMFKDKIESIIVY